jgi:hypothetical protein
MRNIAYKTTCLVNDKYYIGVHLERRESDGYIGSGICSQGSALKLKKQGVKSAFLDSVIKYGYKNFKKEVIKEFDTLEEAYNFEEQLVTKELIKDKNCLNIKLGGIGGKNPNTCKKVELLNCENGEILNFNSQADCAYFLNLQNISGKIKFCKNKYILKGFETHISIKKSDNIVYNFYDIHQASKFIGVKISRLKELLNKKRFSVLGWFLSDFDLEKESGYRHAKKIKKEKKGSTNEGRVL